MKLFEAEFGLDIGIETSSGNYWRAAYVWRKAFETILKQMNENKFMNNGELRTFIDEELDE